MPSLTNRFLDKIQSSFSLDSDWMTRDTNSITWLAHRLEQTIDITNPFEPGEAETLVARALVEVVRNVRADTAQVCELLAMLNRSAIGSAYIYYEQEKAIYSCTKVVFNEENFDWRCIHFQTFAITQLIMAEDMTAYLAEKVMGVVAKAATTREERDHMMYTMCIFTTPELQAEYRFAKQAELQQACDFCNGAGGFSAGASETLVTLEYRFTDSHTAMAQLIADAKHPTLGKGMASFLRIPLVYETSSQAAVQANNLNGLEARNFSQHMGFTGAWTCNQRGDGWELVFTSFLPNYLHAPAIAFDAAITLGFRVHYLESTLYPGREFTKDTWELVMDRLQMMGAAAEAVH